MTASTTRAFLLPVMAIVLAFTSACDDLPKKDSNNNGAPRSTPASDPQQSADTNQAMNNADKFAWDLFIKLNWPALLTGEHGVPDPAKRPGDPGLRVWETWKITTEVGNEVFLPEGRRPSGWDEPSLKNIDGTKSLSAHQFTFTMLDLPGRDPHIESVRAFSPQLNDDGQEARINRPGFEYIVREGLYSLDGQERYRQSGRKVEFPVGAINVKATWRRFTHDEINAGLPKRFYTADVGAVWGLTGLHITSKDLPDWFWATFEQVDNPPPEIPDRDRYTKFLHPRARGGSFVDQRLREVPGELTNTNWQYYVLRGTQVDFVDSMGNPTLLANTQLEGGQQATSSCMGCHARATIGDRMERHTDGSYFYPGGRWSVKTGNRLTVNAGQVPWQQDPQNPQDPLPKALFFPIGAIGAPNPEWFIDSSGRIRYTQLDFIWGFIHAQRESK